MKSLLAILSIFVLISAGLFPVLAQSDSRERLFSVYDLKVDERASTAAQARQIAISKAEEEAFAMLLKKIVPAGELERFVMPAGRSVSDYVLGLEILNERTSSVRYLADLNISFDPNEIEQLLGMQNIQYVAIPPEPILVIPMMWDNGGYLLWESDNILKNFWQEANRPNRIRHYVLPEGTLQERVSITPGKIISGRQKNQLNQLMLEYEAGEILVNVVRIIRDSRGEIERFAMLIIDPINNLEQEIDIRPQFGELAEDVMIRAIDRVLQERDELWKAQSLAQFGALQDMNLLIPADKVSVWAEIIQRMNGLVLIRELNVIKMGLPDSIVHIKFNGTVDQLALAMEQNGLLLLSGEDGYALLRKEEHDDQLANRG